MNRAEGFTPSLSPRFAVYVRDYLLDREIDPQQVFGHCDFDFLETEEHDRPIPIDQVACLFEQASNATGNSAIGINLAGGFHYETSSILIVAMLAADTVRDGLSLLHAYDPYVDSGISTDFHIRRDPVEFSAVLLHEAADTMNQLNEYLMAFLVHSLARATRKPVPLLAVNFQHGGSTNLVELSELFKAPMHFGQPVNSIEFAPEYLDAPFLTSNRLLNRITTQAMNSYLPIGEEGQGFVTIVCRQILKEDTGFQVDSEQIAGQLNMSQRTLRRRLADEGFTFQEAKNMARERQARYLLANTRASLTEIAFDLGYSEPSAFSRAFRGWVGETPQAYRENVRDLLG